MSDLAGARAALEGALAELDGVVAGRRKPTADALARSLHALLRAQLACLDQLERSGAGGAPRPIPAERLDDPDDDELDRLLRDAEPASAAAAARTRPAPRRGALVRLRPVAAARPEEAPAPERPAPDPAAPAAARDDRDGEGDAECASHDESRAALDRFELEDMNRWIESGTLFQMRGDMAYLNVDSSGRLSFDFRAKMKDLGFSVELGLLDAPELKGRVLLFRRP